MIKKAGTQIPLCIEAINAWSEEELRGHLLELCQQAEHSRELSEGLKGFQPISKWKLLQITDESPGVKIYWMIREYSDDIDFNNPQNN